MEESAIKIQNTSNIAFIDGQNLYSGTRDGGWAVDHIKFRIYLKEKYSVTEAYYFLGYESTEQKELYSNLRDAGFTVIFKEHNSSMFGKKKGNVDTDIVFEVMKRLIEEPSFDKIILISGDGDYKKIVDYLLSKGKFEKVLFPNKKFASSLYKQYGSEYFDYLDNIRTYIEYINPLLINEKGS